MTEEEMKALEKEVKKAKRISIEWASQMHDLVEERIPASYEEIPELAQSMYDACVKWKEASDKLKEAQAG